MVPGSYGGPSRTIASSPRSPKASGSPPARPPSWAAGDGSANVGDGNILLSHGIPTVQYGAGDIRIYKEWRPRTSAFR